MEGEIILEITSVTIKKKEKEGSRMKAIADITLDNCFVVHARVIEKDGELFVAMPSHEIAPGKYCDTAHPINKECRKMFHDAVIKEYNKQD